MTRTTRRQCLTGFVGSAMAARGAQTEPDAPVDVFRSGDGGYHTFRIPALIMTKRGTLLAFAEGRRGSASDTGNIDIVLKRSADQGKTWSELQVVSDMDGDTIGNPCPVEERKSGRILLPLTFNRGSVSEKQMIERTVEDRRAVYLMHSDDDGRTWSRPEEITSSVRKPNWSWYATGPGNGIQTRKGRLLIPCDHAVDGTREFYSHVIYSDDRGATWRIGGVVGPKTNECQMAELRDGTLVLNMRSYHGKNRRAVSRSKNGGITWSDLELDEALIEPVCQASLIAAGDVLYYSNPASTKRERMTVKASRDGGRTWNAGRVLHEGPAAYSSLAALKSKQLGCLYECGTKGAYERIVFARFATSWVLS